MIPIKKHRILKALFLSIFVILLSMLAFKYLSTGSHSSVSNQDLDDLSSSGNYEIPTPSPSVSNIVPNDNLSQINEISLTNNQRYVEHLVNPDSTSILLLAKEPTGFNFDTITVLNIEKTEKKIKIINLPRDIYIDYVDEIIEAVRKVNPSYPQDGGFHKINATPSIGKYINYKKDTGRFKVTYIDFLADIVEEIFGIHVNDYAYIQVDGFRNIVDYFGGVTINVPIFMNYSDPSQNFKVYLEKGIQHLNGEQAEGFVRFRRGYTKDGEFKNYGDLFRKDNQNYFIKAFINQHVTLKNMNKLSKISDIVKKNLKTSVDGWDSIVEYAALAEKAIVEKYPIENVDLKFTLDTINESSYVILKQAE